MIDPQHYIFDAIEAAEKNLKVKEPKVQELVKVIYGESDNLDLCYAWDKYQQNKSRLALNSYLLADAPFDLMRQTTHIPMRVLQVYAEYFFDVSVFRDVMDRIHYADRAARYLSADEAQYYMAAMTGGAEYITWMLRGRNEKMPKEVLRHFMMDSYFKSLEHRNAPLTSQQAKLALDWLKQGSHVATQLHRLDPQDDKEAMEELRLALGFEDTTISQYTAGAPKPEDILH